VLDISVQEFAVLGDPVRLEIIEMLARRELTAGEIAAAFDISGPAVSRHLRVLRENGFAFCRHDGQRRIYALNGQAIAGVGAWADQLLEQWRQRFDALGRHLDAAAKKGSRRS